MVYNIIEVHKVKIHKTVSTHTQKLQWHGAMLTMTALCKNIQLYIQINEIRFNIITSTVNWATANTSPSNVIKYIKHTRNVGLKI